MDYNILQTSSYLKQTRLGICTSPGSIRSSSSAFVDHNRLQMSSYLKQTRPSICTSPGSKSSSSSATLDQNRLQMSGMAVVRRACAFIKLSKLSVRAIKSCEKPTNVSIIYFAETLCKNTI